MTDTLNAPVARALNQLGQDLSLSRIRDGVRVLAMQPEIGRPTEDMEPEYREWQIDFGNSGYVALYHYDGQTAVIVALRHPACKHGRPPWR